MAKKTSLASDHLRFAVLATDTVLFTIRDNILYVRLVEVNRPPYYTNTWAFPGGLILPQETAEQAAVRLLSDKAHIDSNKVYAEQLYTFSEIARDPRGRVVAVAYIALVPWDKLTTEEQSDGRSARWMPVKETKGLAYDHDQMLKVALERLRSRVIYTTLIGKLMSREFTLTELEKAYECILKTKLDKRNFRKKILKLNILKALGRKRNMGRARPAELYSFSSPSVHEIEVM